MKLGKLSLAAIVAVTGLTTVASAASLAEAVQGTKINGFVRYRLTDKTVGADVNFYKAVIKVDVPINEALTLRTKSITQGEILGRSNTGQTGTYGQGVTAKATQVPYSLYDVYGVFTGVENLTLQVGQQPIPGPFTDNGATGGDQDHRGTGVVGLYGAGPVTLAAGAFTNSNAKSGQGGLALLGSDIYEVGAIGSVAGINAQAWYVSVDVEKDVNAALTTEEKVQGFSVLLDGAFDLDTVKLSPFAAFTSLDKSDVLTAINGTTTKAKQEQYRAGATVGVSGINLTAAYAANGTDGGDITVGDGDATANFSTGIDGQGQVDLSTLAGETTAIYLAAGAPITETVKGQVEYTIAKVGTAETDANEIIGSLQYAMSPNMNFTTFYSILDIDGSDKADMFRFEAKYKF